MVAVLIESFCKKDIDNVLEDDYSDRLEDGPQEVVHAPQQDLHSPQVGCGTQMQGVASETHDAKSREQQVGR